MGNRKIDLTNQSVGVQRRQEILDGISEFGTFLPKGVMYDDIDRAVIDFVDNDINLSVNSTGSGDSRLVEDKVPVFFFSIQKWGEFTKSWGSSDEYKDVKMPFITVVREPDVQQGTNQNKFWNIPGRRNWTYHKVSTFKDGRAGVDLYKIPQPTSVDLTYNIRFFSNRMQELNTLHNIIQRKFNALQYYINVNAHPMPLILETVQDESKIEDIDARKYYVQTFEVICKGYILDERDFEIVPAIDRTQLNITTGDSTKYGMAKHTKSHNKVNGEVKHLIEYRKTDNPYFRLKMNDNTAITEELNTYNVFATTYYVNDVRKFLPFNIKRNDILELKIDKLQDYSSTVELGGIVNTQNDITITAPQNNSNFSDNANIYIEVGFGGADVTKTEFLSNNKLIKRLEGETVDRFTWMNVPNGVYTIVVKSYNLNNLLAVSEPINVVVGEVNTASDFILTDEYRLYTE
jgi:hypothetical protein